MESTANQDIIRLKLTLLGSKPSIWRRIEIQRDRTLGDLHEAIQIVFGWQEAHLHEFEINGSKFAVIYEGLEEGDAEDADEVPLRDLPLKKGGQFLYTYDFGDHWEHGIEVEDFVPRRSGCLYPRCLKAVRSGPPEDCGGVSGYQRFLRIYRNPRHSEHEEAQEWFGPNFDPKAVDEAELTDELVGVLGDA